MILNLKNNKANLSLTYFKLYLVISSIMKYWKIKILLMTDNFKISFKPFIFLGYNQTSNNLIKFNKPKKRR